MSRSEREVEREEGERRGRRGERGEEKNRDRRKGKKKMGRGGAGQRYMEKGQAEHCIPHLKYACKSFKVQM